MVSSDTKIHIDYVLLLQICGGAIIVLFLIVFIFRYLLHVL